jgi:hypothetical protein
LIILIITIINIDTCFDTWKGFDAISNIYFILAVIVLKVDESETQATNNMQPPSFKRKISGHVDHKWV